MKKGYEVIAEGVARHGVPVVFGLMGDTNMYFVRTLVEKHGVRAINVRHENSAVLAALGYSVTTGNVGVATTTSGPGLTHTATALVSACRAHAPLVLVAGDTDPRHFGHNTQEMDQRMFAAGVGAGFHRVERIEQLADAVSVVFARARDEERPIILSLPFDLQTSAVDDSIQTSDPYVLEKTEPWPSPGAVAMLVERLQGSRRPVFIVGRGASGAVADIGALARRVGAAVGTTLPMKGAFNGYELNLGVIGGFTTDAARVLLAAADLFVAFGASMGHYTRLIGTPIDPERLIVVDPAPQTFTEGHAKKLAVVADAGATAKALLHTLGPGTPAETWGEEHRELLERPAIWDEPDYSVGAGLLDVREVMALIDHRIGVERMISVGIGHYMSFPEIYLQKGVGRRYMSGYYFGSIGQSLPLAIGAAASGVPMLVLEGDGGLFQSLAELETAARHGLDLWIWVMNDGAYGAEVHKLRRGGFEGEPAYFGHADIAGIAAGLGVPSFTPASLADLEAWIDKNAGRPGPMLVDIRISYEVKSPTHRRIEAAMRGLGEAH